MSKARSTTASASATASSLYDALEIDASARDRLERTASFISDLGRRSTEQTFELGDHLHSASEVLAEGIFDTWVKKRCGLSPRSARNYRSVFRNLSSYRDALVDLSVGSTVLFHLSSAQPEQIDEAIAFAEEQGRLTVADVKAILVDGSEQDSQSEADPFSVGGIDGLKALIAAKNRDGLKSYTAHIDMIRHDVEVALAGKRVFKEMLGREIQDLARVAQQELASLARFVEPEIAGGYYPNATVFAKGSHWAEVDALLYKLGSVDHWPKSAEMRNWLSDTVLPVLEWATSKRRNPEWSVGRAATAADNRVAPDEAADKLSPVTPEQPQEPVDTSVSEAVKRMDTALNAATGGFIRVAKEVAVERKQLADVPPLSPEADAAPEKGFKRPAFLDRAKASADGADEAAPASASMP
ncbi:hypothetical protein [Rhizobium mayense]|uniref:DUF3102 domain-containing protein n=1 Tax=Rhizobium mayense TaxID=1312184 RepID=A0ABT7JZJ1_9HYPH|nr:hypothetical protein [Rhizobium mayense]MDL2400324.1 hypothetical protein [Rhizobium mayense]